MNCSFRRDSKRVTCQKPTVMGVWIKPRAAWDDRASLELLEGTAQFRTTLLISVISIIGFI